MRISIGGDHAGPALKKIIIEVLVSKGHTVTNRGTDTTDRVDYPDHAHQVAQDIQNDEADKGILICGSANGVAMTANKHQSVRAGIAWNAEIAKLTRQHNDANVICIPARFITNEEALRIVEVFLSEDFEGGRHSQRVGKIACTGVALLVTVFSSLFAQSSRWAETIQPKDLENHLTILSSDAFEGRETGEPGAEKAAAYIARYFESIGIEPHQDEGYFQEVPMMRSQITGGKLTVCGEIFEFLEDFVFYPGLRDKKMQNVPMKFAGWGGKEDFSGVDFTGSVAVVLAGSKESEEQKWSDNLDEKRLNADSSGARALVIVGNELGEYKGRLKPWLTRKSMRLNKPDPEVTVGTRLPTFFVEGSEASQWWKDTSLKNWKKISKRIKRRDDFKPESMPAANWSFELMDRSGEFTAQNVLGFIPGRDSLLKEEVVVVTAHYDHVGVIEGEVYNGADDDGSGTVAVLELAEAFMEAVNAGEGPRRSVLF
ncbi:MAG TPA: ribose 5-phosphate isomerase B, partial [Opitutae bacterium]|nr:ribose 5-phosphate isomerase B [Opitutae bacterium]